jgi:hypothetical protein
VTEVDDDLKMRKASRRLSPEEDVVGEPDDLDEEIDDLLPADLWF